MCNVQSTKYNVHSTKWGSVIEIAPLMMTSPVCKEVTFVNLVTSDNNLSQTQSIFGPSTTNLWHVMGLSRGTEQVTQIDRRTCGSTFTNTHVLTINTSYIPQVDLVILFNRTHLAGGDRYRDKVKNYTMGNQHPGEQMSAYTKDKTILDRAKGQ
jgi:hypothetical protein